jgi:hypothetical protein
VKRDSELQHKRDLYWQFDKKGRNKKELQDKQKRLRDKKYGIVFSRSIKGKFERMRNLLI